MSTESGFLLNVVKGQIAKELVRWALQRSDYKVYSFGYESGFSALRFDVMDGSAAITESNERLRSTPDLMVHDGKGETRFLEVKYKNVDNKSSKFTITHLDWYKRYWSESFIVMVVPFDSMFYAQEARNLESIQSGKSEWFNIEKSFLPLNTIFKKLRPEPLGEIRSVFATLRFMVEK